jgi:hypothetical protein
MTLGMDNFTCPDHPLTRGQFYYTLPGDLLEPALVAMGRKNSAVMDADVVGLDRRMSQLSGDHTWVVGFWNRTPIHHDALRERPLPSTIPIDQETVNDLGWELQAAQVQLALELTDKPYVRIQRSRRAYCGWLLSNLQFIQEHDTFWNEWQPAIQRFGIPLMGPAVTQPRERTNVHRARGRLRDLLEALEAFLRRWDLAQLVGPRLPLPLSPQIQHLGQPGHADLTVQQFSVPRSVSLPGQELSYAMIDGSLGRSHAPEHLKPWMDIVAKKNAAKHPLGRLARLFEHQHFWRVLHDRYGPACVGLKGELERIIAKFLRVDHETVHRDLQYLRDQLGPDWHLTSSR